MKAIFLTIPTKSHDVFEVKLGNGTIYKFTSERSAKHFLAQTSKFLTFHLFELNTLYTEVFTSYRRSWFYFDNTRETAKAAMYQDERNIETNFQLVNDLFTRLARIHLYSTAGIYSFIHLRKICNLGLLPNIHTLKKYAEKRGDTAEVYNLQVLIKRTIQVVNELDNYGQMECCAVFDLSTHKLPNEFSTIKLHKSA